MKAFNKFLDEAGPCWAGYKPVPGKKKFEKGSCMKEGTTSGDSSLHDWFAKSKSSDGKPGWVQLGGRYAGKSCAKQPGQTTKPKCGSSKMAANMSDKEEDAAARRKREQDPNPNRSGAPINVPTEGKRKMKESIDEYIAKSECPECGGHMVSEDELTEEKDACYHKVKSRYSVFPSAYASGALVKCRKVGAANWGNKTKQEGTQLKSFGSFINEAANAAQQAAIAINMKKKGIKPKNEEVELEEDINDINHVYRGKQPHTHVTLHDMYHSDGTKVPKGTTLRKVEGSKKMYVHLKNGRPVTGSHPLLNLHPEHVKSINEEVEQIDETEAWQRKEGQNQEGGLNRKGIQSYRAAHPGSHLSMAVTTKPSKLKAGSKAANRRKSFCARMSGMKRRLTSAKTAHDPNSRINKSLRKWNC